MISLPTTFVYLSVANYIYRRIMEDNIPEADCRTHGLRAAEEAWRSFHEHNPGPELEGMVASWVSEAGLRDYDLRTPVYTLLFGAQHRWSTP